MKARGFAPAAPAEPEVEEIDNDEWMKILASVLLLFFVGVILLLMGLPVLFNTDRVFSAVTIISAFFLSALGATLMYFSTFLAKDL